MSALLNAFLRAGIDGNEGMMLGLICDAPHRKVREEAL